ncbi:MAG: L,D-transpeptidase family protein [Vicinamibacterales bacterium]
MSLVCACRATPPSGPPASGNASSSTSSASPAPAAAALDPDVAATVDQILSSANHPSLRWGAIPDVVPVLRPLYDDEPDRLFWFDGTKPSPALGPVLATLAAAGDHGLDAADYDAGPLAEQWSGQRKGASAPADRALLDVGVSVAVVRMLRAVFIGRVDPATIYWGYDVKTKKADFAALLREVRGGKSLAATLDALSPQVTHYARARRTLAVYKKLAAAGEPPRVPELPKNRSKVTAGQSWDGIADLAVRLRTVGDLAGDAPVEGDVYSAPLVAGVQHFQERHGLDADGTIGAGTIGALNVSLAARVRQIELAMERMRWLPVLSEEPNVFVNLPMFRMWATDPTTGDEPLRMNVVVGKSLGHQTPIFVEQMEYVIFRPYWTPPSSIAIKEIVPHIRRDPSYFAKEDLEIVASGEDSAPTFEPTPENLSKVVAGRLHIRQRPGPKNSLGLAKFIFPNADDVYMHGTPAQQLFSRVRRDFSHGCIRLEDPARFAEWVLRDQPEWTRAKIDAAMQATKPQRVNLKHPLTVVLFYDTVHVNSEGVVFFVRDIYGDDRELDVALGRGYPYPVKD